MNLSFFLRSGYPAEVQKRTNKTQMDLWGRQCDNRVGKLILK